MPTVSTFTVVISVLIKPERNPARGARGQIPYESYAGEAFPAESLFLPDRGIACGACLGKDEVQHSDTCKVYRPLTPADLRNVFLTGSTREDSHVRRALRHSRRGGTTQRHFPRTLPHPGGNPVSDPHRHYDGEVYLLALGPQHRGAELVYEAHLDLFLGYDLEDVH